MAEQFKDMPDQDELRGIIRSLDVQKQILELKILRTPSGDKRNVLAEANIHIQVAIGKLLDLA